MTEQYIGWALVVGIALGAAVVWFVLGRLPRRSEDVTVEERAAEARWISQAIESRGGIAPPALVDEVLELHTRYLEGPPLDVRPTPPILVTGRAPASHDEPTSEEASDPDEEPLFPDESEFADEDRRSV